MTREELHALRSSLGSIILACDLLETVADNFKARPRNAFTLGVKRWKIMSTDTPGGLPLLPLENN